MNLEIANRLVEYRKKAGYSQEELADKLGISRQAISKWERVEASPDTDNLIALANLYGISLDELINGKKDGTMADPVTKEEHRAKNPDEEDKKYNESEDVEQEVCEEGVHIGKDGIHVTDDDGSYVHIDSEGVHIKDKKDGKQNYSFKDVKDYDCTHQYRGEKPVKEKEHPVVKALYSLCGIAAVIGYILIGTLVPSFSINNNEIAMSGWAVGWILFIFMPVIPSLFDAIIHLRFCKFNYPCLVTSAFLFFGLMLNIWHPLWVVFLTIPAYYLIFGPIDGLVHKDWKRH